MGRNDIISKVYFDRSGFGSKKNTLEDARKTDKTVTKSDVDEFFLKECSRKEKVEGL